jgi:quercetin dioxygenase-like cupin family protein
MDAMTAASPVIRAHPEGQRRWFFGGGTHTWKVTSEESAGAFLLFEDSMQRGKRTPLHIHPESDETMYVLEGEIVMHMDGVEHTIGEGGLAMAPRGVPHAFLVTSAMARLLCLHTPGSCQAFYWGASEAIGSSEADGPVDFGQVQASARQHGGIEILGPPPFPQ